MSSSGFIDIDPESDSDTVCEDAQKVDILDNALAQYYKDCGRDDYFNNETGEGKFMEYAYVAIGDDEGYVRFLLKVIMNLGDDANDPNDCEYVDEIDEIDPMFPLPISTNESRANDIFQVLKHCYKYGVAPF
eukprot:906499_1